MDELKRLKVENELVKAILTFHDCDNKEKRENYVREYFLEYCQKNDINQEEALEMIEKALKFKRENTIFKYEHFTDLKSIIYPKDTDNKAHVKDLDEDDDAR